MTRCRGGSLVYAIISLPVLAGICSLAVDYGHAQLVKTELRRTADATAHDYMVLYNTYGQTYAIANGPQTYSLSNNPVECLSGNLPTVTVTWGYWNQSTKSFSTSNNGGNVAVRVNASYTKANGNAVPLLFGSVLGARSVDVSATAIAMSTPAESASVNVSATSNPYLSGMPSTETSFNGDNGVTNAPTQVSGISVTPGSVLTFTNFTGSVSVLPGWMPYAGPGGVSNNPYGTATHHGMSWDGSGSPTSENGIADAVMPESSLMGVFLDDNQPDSTPAPATVDWTSAAMNNQSTYTNLQLKAPFYIGTGSTTGGAVKQFVVPPGATRLYVGAWDGIQYNNNGGSFSGTITRKNTVTLVK